MKTTLLKIAFFVFLFISRLSLGAENDLNSAFNTYQKSYQSGDFEAAKASLEEVLKKNSHNSYIIYNLGLTEYKLGKVGLALGLWRKALTINPQLNEAREALNYALSHMDVRPLASDTDSSWDWIKRLITENLSFNFVWPLFLICFFAFGYQCIKYWGAKKKAFNNDEVPPVLGARPIFFLMVSVLLGVVSFVSLKDILTPKATAIAKPTLVKTGPNSEFGTLFEIPEGTEVLIRDKEDGWYKIEDPTGRVGWAQNIHIFVTTAMKEEKNL